MTTTTNTNTSTKVDAGYEASKFALGVGITMAALVGVWGAACLVNALLSNGPVDLLKSYFIAITG